MDIHFQSHICSQEIPKLVSWVNFNLNMKIFIPILSSPKMFVHFLVSLAWVLDALYLEFTTNWYLSHEKWYEYFRRNSSEDIELRFHWGMIYDTEILPGKWNASSEVINTEGRCLSIFILLLFYYVSIWYVNTQSWVCSPEVFYSWEFVHNEEEIHEWSLVTASTSPSCISYIGSSTVL